MARTEVHMVLVRAQPEATATSVFPKLCQSILNLRLEDVVAVSLMDSCADSLTSVLKSLASGARRKASCTVVKIKVK